jgi:hypothetical protein
MRYKVFQVRLCAIEEIRGVRVREDEVEFSYRVVVAEGVDRGLERDATIQPRKRVCIFQKVRQDLGLRGKMGF